MRFFWSALVLFMAGCSQENKTLPYPLSLTEEGLGAIHPDTPFEEIPTAILGFECEKLTAVSSSNKELIYQIKRGGDPLAHVVSDPSGKKIASIHILSPLSPDSRGQTLGDPLMDEPFICDNTRCFDPETPALHYTIDPDTRRILEITLQRL